MSVISPDDRYEIEQLITRYSFTWDSADEEGFAGLFTEDAQCRFYLNGSETPDSEIHGPDGFRKAVEVRAKYFKKIGLITKHFMPNTVITPMDPNTVKTRTQAMITWQLIGTDLQPRPVQAGYYNSHILRTDLGWKFASREVFLNGVFRVKEVYADRG